MEATTAPATRSTLLAIRDHFSNVKAVKANKRHYCQAVPPCPNGGIIPAGAWYIRARNYGTAGIALCAACARADERPTPAPAPAAGTIQKTLPIGPPLTDERDRDQFARDIVAANPEIISAEVISPTEARIVEVAPAPVDPFAGLTA